MPTHKSEFFQAPRPQAPEIPEAMQRWLRNISATNASDLWEMLSKLRETGRAPTPTERQLLLCGHNGLGLVSAATLTADGGVSRVSQGPALLGDARFVAALGETLGAEPHWWAMVLAGEVPPTLSTVTATQAVRQLKALVCVITNIITIKW